MNRDAEILAQATERNTNQRISDEHNRRFNENKITKEISYVRDNNTVGEIALGLTLLVAGIGIGLIIAL